MATKTKYVIRCGSDFLGRMTLDTPLGPVPYPFAYVYPTLAEAERTMELYGERTETDDLEAVAL